MKYITQTELSKKLGISWSHVQYYIKTGKIRSKTKYGKVLVESDPILEIRKNNSKKSN